MAEEVTKDQHDFFRALYDEEERTAAQLENRAKVFLGVISAFLAAILLKASDAKALADTLHVPWWLLLLVALTMTCALLLILWALRIRDFEAVNDGEDVLAGYEAEWPTPAQFFEDRAVDYAVASSRNRKMNSETAGVLAWAGRLLSAGILMLIAIVCYAIRRG